MHLISRYGRLHSFIEKRIKEDIYPEPIGEPHLSITSKVIAEYNIEINLKNKYVLDVGCGQGLALEQFKACGAIAKGITFGEDLLVCKRKGLDVVEMDMSFLEFADDSFDLIWARHVVEHSLFPFLRSMDFIECCDSAAWLTLRFRRPIRARITKRIKIITPALHAALGWSCLSEQVSK